MNGSKHLPVLLWLTAFILVGVILSQLPLASILVSIGRLSLPQWLAWIGINLAIISLATQRWQILIRLLNIRLGFVELLMIRQAGQAISFITPGPQFGGEPWQIFWLYQRGQMPIHRALLAVGLDRFYELWINFAVLLLAVLLLLTSAKAPIDNGQNILLVLSVLLLTLSVAGWLILKQPERVLVSLKKLTVYWHHHPRLQNIETHWQRLGSDLQSAMREKKPALLKALLISLCGWVGLIGELWLLLSFFDLPLTLSTFLLILIAMRLAFLLPLPGGLGTLEAALFWAFHSLNLAETAVLGLIALMRLRDALTLFAGLICLRGMHARQ